MAPIFENSCQQLRSAHADLDEDSSGTVSVEALQRGLKEKCSLANPEVVQITSVLDVNNDGQVPRSLPPIWPCLCSSGCRPSMEAETGDRDEPGPTRSPGLSSSDMSHTSAMETQ